MSAFHVPSDPEDFLHIWITNYHFDRLQSLSAISYVLLLITSLLQRRPPRLAHTQILCAAQSLEPSAQEVPRYLPRAHCDMLRYDVSIVSASL